MWGINKRTPLMDIDIIDLSSILVHDPMLSSCGSSPAEPSSVNGAGSEDG